MSHNFIIPASFLVPVEQDRRGHNLYSKISCISKDLDEDKIVYWKGEK